MSPERSKASPSVQSYKKRVFDSHGSLVHVPQVTQDSARGVEAKQMVEVKILPMPSASHFSQEQASGLEKQRSAFDVKNGGEMRRQKSEMNIVRNSQGTEDGPSKLLVHKDKSQKMLSLNRQNCLEVPRVLRATPAAYHKQVLHSPESRMQSTKVPQQYEQPPTFNMQLSNQNYAYEAKSRSHLNKKSWQTANHTPTQNQDSPFQTTQGNRNPSMIQPAKPVQQATKRKEQKDGGNSCAKGYDQSLKPRVHESLLLDDFFIKKTQKEVLPRKTLHKALLDCQSPQVGTTQSKMRQSSVGRKRIQPGDASPMIEKDESDIEGLKNHFGGLIAHRTSQSASRPLLTSVADTRNAIQSFGSLLRKSGAANPNTQPLPLQKGTGAKGDQQQSTEKHWDSVDQLPDVLNKLTQNQINITAVQAKTGGTSSPDISPLVKEYSITATPSLSHQSSGETRSTSLSKQTTKAMKSEPNTPDLVMDKSFRPQCSSVSPVRVSQNLFDVSKLKAQAMKVAKEQHKKHLLNVQKEKDNRTPEPLYSGAPTGLSSHSGSDFSKRFDEPQKRLNADSLELRMSNQGYEPSAIKKPLSTAQHAISSLSKVQDSQKFSEIIDKMFVPTVQAYRQKEKERPFRRPTQNPRIHSSSSPSQRAAARQRLEAKQRLLQQKQQQTMQPM